MSNEIVHVCNSINNKNVREGELKILRKNEEGLYFEFGESENNIKKRFYRNIDVLNEDFNKVKEIKEKIEAQEKVVVEEKEAVVEKEDNVEEKPKKNRTSKTYYKRNENW